MSSRIYRPEHERRRHASRVFQSRENTYRSRGCVDVIPIIFFRFKACANYNPDTRRYDNEEPILLCRKILKLRFSRERVSGDAKTTMERFVRYRNVIERSPREANKLRDKLRRYLVNAVGLQEDGLPYVIERILIVLQDAVPHKIIEVHIMDLLFRNTVERHRELEDRLYYRANSGKLIPATESFIQALEEASPVDDDELVCAICREMFAHRSSSITQLPCSHYYHRDCIVPWLHINHLCPTCRHPNAPSS